MSSGGNKASRVEVVSTPSIRRRGIEAVRAFLLAEVPKWIDGADTCEARHKAAKLDVPDSVLVMRYSGALIYDLAKQLQVPPEAEDEDLKAELRESQAELARAKEQIKKLSGETPLFEDGADEAR